ncbi:Coronin-like protein [Hondaea fermentalgiana]|uniref:Coronin n=1 Tax=Hondaea fermentalgiana TaxID=2315210 RepID=A0A2R5GGZ4_9STRA|nr:Coronin-like protein [Hondaea fermentalgiana]|eukprot:GBG27124.1 Coronin-like protein [Hondaea fermentalgiana]
MSRIVRASKVRHVYCEPAKQEFQYHGLRISSATGDHNYIKANTTFLAYAVTTGGGALTVVPLADCGKLDPCLPVLDGHKGAVLDFDFNPFDEHMLASGGDDCTVKVWALPRGGLTENIMDPVVNMAEHQKKVTVVRYHPTAENVLATGSADSTVKIWDVQRAESVATCADSEQLIQDVVWSYDGSLLATSAKDKFLRIVDPRNGEIVQKVLAHDGAKTSKLTFLGAGGNLCSVGFTRSSKRQFKVWDPRNLEKPLATCDIDQGAGVIMPFFDEGTNLLYLAGKGDGNIRYFEITGEAPFQFHVGDYRASSPAKGIAIVPKRSCDVTRCEVTRFLKLTKNSVEPLSFICPRKSDVFQPDLFPDAYAGKAALSADDFFAGKNASPILASLDPKDRAAMAGEEAPTSTLKPLKTARELEAELTSAKAYILQLRSSLEEHGVDIPTAPATLMA